MLIQHCSKIILIWNGHNGSHVQIKIPSGNVLAIGPRIAGSNPAKVNEFLRLIKIRSTTSIGWEVNPGVPGHTFRACNGTFH
jgi:hypothetical protein